jgi:tRNA (adenine57-N1/adenine58-N1)-methyltransferase
LSRLIINEKDHVLLYLNSKRTYLVKVEKRKSFHTHKGFIQLDDLIGKEYGAQITSNTDTEFIALKPKLRDYIFKSQRRTQITYPKDVALIVMFSGIGPGSLVVEAGTGTGALTTALAHYVRPDGHVFSYEIHPEFTETAQKNLERGGLIECVTLKNKDIITNLTETNIDAIVLDLATPWLVVPSAYNALKGSGTFVSFSPTIDQVVKTTEALVESKFVHIETVECIMRRMQIERGKTRPETLMTGHTGYVTYAIKTLKAPS